MVPRIRALLAAALLVSAVALPGFASVPAPPPISTVPSCFATCPLGDMHIVVIVRDLASNPIFGALVVLDFSACPNAYVCTSPAGDPYVYDPLSRTIRMTTDASGKVDFPLRVGGGCGPGGVKIYANGVFLQSYALASPDQTGNGMVVCFAIDTDCDVFSSKLGTGDPTADFDCDGDVDLDDQLTMNLHGSHSCHGIVDPAKRSDWGRVKAFYR